jgi:hypothetical protein
MVSSQLKDELKKRGHAVPSPSSSPNVVRVASSSSSSNSVVPARVERRRSRSPLLGSRPPLLRRSRSPLLRRSPSPHDYRPRTPDYPHPDDLRIRETGRHAGLIGYEQERERSVSPDRERHYRQPGDGANRRGHSFRGRGRGGDSRRGRGRGYNRDHRGPAGDAPAVRSGEVYTEEDAPSPLWIGVSKNYRGTRPRPNVNLHRSGRGRYSVEKQLER